MKLSLQPRHKKTTNQELIKVFHTIHIFKYKRTRESINVPKTNRRTYTQPNCALSKSQNKNKKPYILHAPQHTLTQTPTAICLQRTLHKVMVNLVHVSRLGCIHGTGKTPVDTLQRNMPHVQNTIPSITAHSEFYSMSFHQIARCAQETPLTSKPAKHSISNPHEDHLTLPNIPIMVNNR